jgi:hypothetical protein
VVGSCNFYNRAIRLEGGLFRALPLGGNDIDIGNGYLFVALAERFFKRLYERSHGGQGGGACMLKRMYIVMTGEESAIQCS